MNKILDFSYEKNINSPPLLNNKKLNIVNIFQAFFLFDSIAKYNMSNEINETLEAEVETLLNETDNTFVFVHKINELMNHKRKIHKKHLKPTIINSFNKKLLTMIESDVTIIGNHYIKYIDIPYNITLEIETKEKVNISTDNDGLHFYELKNISNEYQYIISGSDSYEAEFIYWTLKDDYKIDDVINSIVQNSTTH